MDQPGELHPVGLAITSHGFGGLEQVLDLRETRVRVALVDEGVEFLDGFPDGHPSPGLAVKLFTGLEVELESLLCVLLGVKHLRGHEDETVARVSSRKQSRPGLVRNRQEETLDSP